MNKRNILYLLSALLIASMVLTACGGTDSGNNAAADNNNMAENNMANDAANDTADDTASDDAVVAAADYPFKNENVYVAASIGEPETLDPAWTYETSGSAIETNVYEGLVWFERERNDVFVPLLATSWETNDAGDVWTFHIREGVVFHEGGTLEPHDVAYSLQRAMMQDRSSGPHWMTHEVFFGTYSMMGGTVDKYFATVLEAEGFDADAEGAVAREMTDADYVGACEYVKAAIVADDAAGTVTYTLDTPAPWFTAILEIGRAHV